MVKRSVRVRLNDMLGAVDGVIEIAEELAFEDYQQHFVFRRAVERCVEIVNALRQNIFQSCDWSSSNFCARLKAVGTD